MDKSYLLMVGIDNIAFSNLLVRTGAFVAGSFTLNASLEQPLAFAANDIDIWLPHTSYTMSHMATIVSFFVEQGYNWPIRSIRGDGSPYLRLETTVHTVYTMSVKDRINVQVILMRDNTTPMDIVKNFDLTMLQAWYDGRMLHTTTTAAEHTAHRIMEVNIESDQVANQTSAEWLRTLRRISKYQARGFTLVTNNIPHMGFLHTLLAHPDVHITKTFIEKWNEYVYKEHIGLPYIFLTSKGGVLSVGTTRERWVTCIPWYMLSDDQRKNVIEYPNGQLGRRGQTMEEWIRHQIDGIPHVTAPAAADAENIMLVVELPNGELRQTCYSKTRLLKGTKYV
jgi:hypothetical protein